MSTSSTFGRTIVPVLFLAALSTEVSGQASADQCRDVLTLQISNRLQQVYTSDTNFSQTVQLCNLNQESDWSAHSWNAGVNVVLPNGMMIGLKGGEAEQKARSVYSQFCGAGATQREEHTFFATASRVLDPAAVEAVVRAWQVCIAANPIGGDLAPLQISGIPNSLEEFALRVKFSGAVAPLTSPPVISALETGSTIKCDKDSVFNVLGRRVIGTDQFIVCKRESANGGVVIVRTSWGDKATSVPSIANTPSAAVATPAFRTSCTLNLSAGVQRSCSNFRPGAAVRISILSGEVDHGDVYRDTGCSWGANVTLVHSGSDDADESRAVFNSNGRTLGCGGPAKFSTPIEFDTEVPPNGTVRVRLNIASCSQDVQGAGDCLMGPKATASVRIQAQ